MTGRRGPRCEAEPRGIVEVTTTVASPDQARELARGAVEECLAACATWDRVRSTYRWRGGVEEEDECRITLKTSRPRADALVAWIRGRHPYEVPMILRRDDDGVNVEYERWVDESTSATSGDARGEEGEES